MILGFKTIYITGVELPDKKKDYNYFDCLEADKLNYKTYKIYDQIIEKKYKSLYSMVKFFFKKNFNSMYLALLNFFFTNTDFYNNSNQLYESIGILSKLAKKNKIYIKYYNNNKILTNLFD